jgi:hypothetical protein
MNTSTKRIFFGAALILFGALFLVQQIFHPVLHIFPILVALVFALAGISFLYVLSNNVIANWWAAIPGMVLLGLGTLIGSSELFPRFGSLFGGSLFLGFIGLAFLLVLIVTPHNWWAVIPAGVLFTLAILAGVGNYLNNGFGMGALFFLGLALTFAVVGLMPVGRKEKWPWIPAGICGVMGTLLMLGSKTLMNSVFGYFWPAVLILGGAFLVYRSLTAKKE